MTLLSAVVFGVAAAAAAAATLLPAAAAAAAAAAAYAAAPKPPAPPQPSARLISRLAVSVSRRLQFTLRREAGLTLPMTRPP